MNVSNNDFAETAVVWMMAIMVALTLFAIYYVLKYIIIFWKWMFKEHTDLATFILVAIVSIVLVFGFIHALIFMDNLEAFFEGVKTFFQTEVFY